MRPGDEATDFTLEDQNGRHVSLSDFRGSWVVLYFYPKDNTPGCTTEACDFTAAKPAFETLDAVVVGVSRDNAAVHQGFMAKNALDLVLLSDPKAKVHKLYEAWGMKKLYGKQSEGVIRSTFLIDPEGRIADSWANVKVRVSRKDGEVLHSDVVRKRLEELRGGK
ncbi:MAG: peroxiredoxin [Deltaproteobacteria bacterium]|nr:peroxiredoxin [Deltaproteobacteria bacterium]